jgi:hypothetical protein
MNRPKQPRLCGCSQPGSGWDAAQIPAQLFGAIRRGARAGSGACWTQARFGSR